MHIEEVFCGKTLRICVYAVTSNWSEMCQKYKICVYNVMAMLFKYNIGQECAYKDLFIFLIFQLSCKARKLTHFHYTGWPDHGVPDYATSILTFHKRVMKDHRLLKGPILVHCR